MSDKVTGKLVSRPRDDDEEDEALPPILEGTIRFFEGFAKDSVTFSYLEVKNRVACSFCALPTNHRLQVNRGGEEMRTPLCPDCKSNIGHA